MKKFYVILMALLCIYPLLGQNEKIELYSGYNNNLYIMPNSVLSYTYILENGNQHTSATWTISEGGKFVVNGLTGSTTTTTITGSHRVDIHWSEPESVSKNRPKITVKWPTGSTTVTVTLLTLKGYTLPWIRMDNKNYTTTMDIPYNKTSFNIETKNLIYPGVTSDDSLSYRIGHYQWTLPSVGWTPFSVFRAPYYFTVYPDKCSGNGGKIIVRPMDNYNVHPNYYGNPLEVTITRSFPATTLTASPNVVTVGRPTNVTFTATAETMADAYEWVIPEGYANSGTVTTTNNSITVENNGYGFSSVSLTTVYCGERKTYTMAVKPDPNALVVPQNFGSSGTAMLDNRANLPVQWSVSPSDKFGLQNSTIKSVVISPNFWGNTSGTLTAAYGGASISQPFTANWIVDIIGSSAVCAIGSYTLTNEGKATSWSVTPSDAFTITASNATSATVTATRLGGQSGTLTVVGPGGVTISKIIQTCQPVISGPDVIGANCQGDYSIQWGSGVTPMGISNVQWFFSSLSMKVESTGAYSCRVSKRTLDFDVVNTPQSQSLQPSPSQISLLPPSLSTPSVTAAIVFASQTHTLNKEVQVGAVPRIHGVMDAQTHQVMAGVGVARHNYYLQSSSTPTNLIHDYIWEFSDASSPFSMRLSGSQTSVFQFTNTDHMMYTIHLQIRDDCGQRSTSTPFYVYAYSNNPWNYTVYPNPVSSVLYFNSSATAVSQSRMALRWGDCRVRLVAVGSGALVLEQTVADFDNSFDIDVSSVPDGLYMMVLSRDNEIVQQQNILIQH